MAGAISLIQRDSESVRQAHHLRGRGALLQAADGDGTPRSTTGPSTGAPSDSGRSAGEPDSIAGSLDLSPAAAAWVSLIRCWSRCFLESVMAPENYMKPYVSNSKLAFSCSRKRKQLSTLFRDTDSENIVRESVIL